MGSISYYFHTLRHLKPVQIYGRIVFFLMKPKLDLRPSPRLRPVSGPWHEPARKKPSLLGPLRFRFLNKEHEFKSFSSWSSPELEKTWLYHLQYFDDLNALDFERRKSWHHVLLINWLQNNPPGEGNAWEPYPLSLRIVNWIKWALTGNVLSQELLDSLAAQARFLRGRLEIHLLGNHLLANAKALIFAGFFFEGSEAEEWLNKGLEIFFQQLPEQILADGGHFERSPMYHSIILEDLLDLINIFETYSDSFPSPWKNFKKDWPDYIQRMRFWLKAMTHPDGQIALFNDSAFDIACAPQELDRYAQRLGFGKIDSLQDGSIALKESGYIRIQCAEAVLILDVGEIGPDYLPAHAHADTLSYEFSLFGKRCIVDSGTSSYALGKQRQYERSTAAHNTVQLEHADSSETWGSFRVARRARPQNLHIEKLNDAFRVVCGHDGYRKLPGRPIHHREWVLKENQLTVKDIVKGPFQKAESRFHFHPEISLKTPMPPQEGSAFFASGEKMQWTIQNGQADLEKSTYHPEFGMSEENSCLKIRFQNKESQIKFSWGTAIV